MPNYIVGTKFRCLNEVITDKELAEGYVLSCTAFPESDSLEVLA